MIVCIDCGLEIIGKNKNTKRCLPCKKLNNNILQRNFNAKKFIENPNYYKERYSIYGEKDNKCRSEKYHNNPEIKAKKSYYNNNKRKDGYFKEWHLKNKEKENLRSRKYRSKNKDKCNNLTAQYRIRNIQKIKEKDKQNIINLSDSRVALSIRAKLKIKDLKITEIPKSVIETHRNILLINREIKQTKLCLSQLTK